MPNTTQDVAKRWPVLAALALIASPALPQAPANPLSTQQLRDFRREAEAFNQQDPMANGYRAGHYHGYLAGVLDSLQGRRVCFRECVCELDKLVAKYLADHGEAREAPVVEWLVPLLERSYPCP